MNQSYYERLSESKTAVLDLTDYYGHGLVITRVNVPEDFRGQRHGSRLLDKCLADADRDGVNLYLEISPSGPLDSAALVAWYRRRGFEGNATTVMHRKPKRGG